MSTDSSVYFGVDVSKHTNSTCFEKRFKEFKNTPAGRKSLIAALPAHAHVVLEATGGYERSLADDLHLQGISVSVVNPARVRDYAKCMGQLAKTDKIDARMITEYAQVKKLQPDTPRSESQVRLSELVSCRSQLIEMRIMETNRLEHFRFKEAINACKDVIKVIEKRIAKLEQLIAKEIENDPILKAKFVRLSQVDGIGLITAATLLANMPELGSLSRNQASALIGVAPVNHDSATIQKPRRISGGRFNVRTVLYMAALTAARTNPIFKEIYQRLIQTKPHKVAIVAVMRKLIMFLNHILKNPDFVVA